MPGANPFPGRSLRSLWWPVTAAYAALILYVGSRPHLNSPVTFPLWDKVAHLGEYGVFGLLGYVTYARRRPGWTRLAVVALIGAVIGIVDETIQAHTPGRESSVFDWAADLAGLLLAIGLARGIDGRRAAAGAGRRAR